MCKDISITGHCQGWNWGGKVCPSLFQLKGYWSIGWSFLPMCKVKLQYIPF